MAGRPLSALPVRPRTAIALALLILVGIVVVIGKMIGGAPPVTAPDSSSRLSTVDPSTGNDSVVELNPSPAITQPSNTQPALTVATAFAENWINKNRPAATWRASLQPFSTKTLTEELAEADPVTVPAERLTGPPVTQVHAETSADIIFPTDAGNLRLRLVYGTEGRWLVDGIDWERA